MTSTPEPDAPESAEVDEAVDGAHVEVIEVVLTDATETGVVADESTDASEQDASETDASAAPAAAESPEPEPEPEPLTDAELVRARDLALAALAEITPAHTVGAPAGHRPEPTGAFSLLFETTLPGYPQWFWTVTLARVAGEEPTVLEVELLPGEGALLAPEWVPWAERLAEYQAQQAAARLAGEAAEDDEHADDEDAEGDDELEDDEDLDDDDDESDDDEHADDDEDDDEDDDFDASPILHSGDVDGVDIDELDDAADDEDSDEDESDDDDDSDDDDEDIDDESDDDDESDEDSDDDSDEDATH
ncbi:DUF3027 domain-containing protein [uncultured Microbacterium sp.]|uniref:DUF3027 domain-containing protein n=1 Tax=uncultured Microbacterium sp. TaxID=191216 RepID=UPI00345B3089